MFAIEMNGIPSNWAILATEYSENLLAKHL